MTDLVRVLPSGGVCPILPRMVCWLLYMADASWLKVIPQKPLKSGLYYIFNQFHHILLKRSNQADARAVTLRLPEFVHRDVREFVGAVIHLRDFFKILEREAASVHFHELLV